MTKPSTRSRRKTLFRLIGYIGRHKYLLFLAIALTFAANSLSLVGPFLSGRAIDAFGIGSGQVDFERVFHYAGLMAIFYIGSAIFTYLLARLMITLSQKIVYVMRREVFHRLSELPVKYFDTHQTGDLISRITYDIDTINTSLSNDVVQIFTSLFTIFGSLFMMISIAPILVSVFTVTIPIAILFTRFMARKTRPLFKMRSEKLGELNGYVEEIVSAQSVIKAYRQEEMMLSRFDQKNDAAAQATYHAEHYAVIVGPSMNFINNLALTLVSVFGAILYINGAISLGNISSFVLYSRKFSGPINELANIASELQSALSAAERVFKVLDELPEPPDAADAVELNDVQGAIEIDELCFGYDPEKPIIQNLNLKVEPGQLIAIVGPTGAGKTTIINLLMRFYDPQSGSIRLDGIDIRNIRRSSLRGAFSMVLQDTWLFNGTVYENLAYGRPEATKEEIVAAAKAAKIHGFISKLPLGYDTVLDEEGLNISQGQKQLFTIARAMVKSSKMLILDEATSNVDTNTEAEIQEAMRSLMQGKTSFVIAHRLSTIRGADNILVIGGGKVMEQGSHEELLEQGGIYAEMFRSQFAEIDRK